MSKYTLNKLNGSIIVFLVIFICHLVLKRVAIFGNILISDDLILFPKAILGPYGGGGWHYDLSAYLLQSLVLQKVYYLFLFSISAVLLWLILYRFFQRKGILLAALLVAFLAPMTVDQGICISGSHSAIGLAMIGIGFLLSYSALCGTHKYGIRVLLAISAGIFYLFAAMFSTLFYLVFLAPLLFPWWHNKYSVGSKWKLVGLLLISTFTVPLIQLTRHFLFNQGIVSHYAGMLGWVDYSLTNVINQGIKFFQAVIGQFGILAPFLFLVLLVLIFGIFLSRPKREETKDDNNERPHYFSGLLFISAVFVLIMAPISATVFMPYRYVTGPGIFVILLAFLVLDYALNRLTKKYSLLLSSKTYTYLSLIGLLVLVGFVFNSYYRACDTYHGTYDNLIKTEIILENFILNEEHDWEENAQVVILINDFPGRFTSGYNHWSTWYLRYITKRQDVIGLIGQEGWLVHYPFVDEYRDHGGEYWYEIQREGESFIARKRMVGLEQGRPTYIYRVGENVIEVNWIKIQDGGQIHLYHATVSGIEYEGQYTTINISEADNEYGISIDNSITYTVSPVEIPP